MAAIIFVGWNKTTANSKSWETIQCQVYSMHISTLELKISSIVFCSYKNIITYMYRYR